MPNKNSLGCRKRLPLTKVESLVWLIRAGTDIKLWPSRSEDYHNEFIKTAG